MLEANILKDLEQVKIKCKNCTYFKAEGDKGVGYCDIWSVSFGGNVTSKKKIDENFKCSLFKAKGSSTNKIKL